MEDFFKRLAAAIIFFALGMHGIGYGMMANGGAHRSNPVWRLMQEYYDFEWGVVRFILIVAGIAGGLFALMVAFTSIKDCAEAARVRSEEEEKRQRIKKFELERIKSQTGRGEWPRSQAHGAQLLPATAQTPVAPAPVPKKLTPDELRQRAIAQFTKGR